MKLTSVPMEDKAAVAAANYLGSTNFVGMFGKTSVII